MKLQEKFYEMIKNDELLQIELLKMPEFKHQNIDSLISMAHVKHRYLVLANVVKIIVDYYNMFLSENKKITTIQALEVAA